MSTRISSFKEKVLQKLQISAIAIKSITILASTMQLFRLAKSNLLIWILHVRKQKPEMEIT